MTDFFKSWSLRLRFLWLSLQLRFWNPRQRSSYIYFTERTRRLSMRHQNRLLHLLHRRLSLVNVLSQIRHWRFPHSWRILLLRLKRPLRQRNSVGSWKVQVLILRFVWFHSRFLFNWSWGLSLHSFNENGFALRTFLHFWLLHNFRFVRFDIQVDVSLF